MIGIYYINCNMQKGYLDTNMPCVVHGTVNILLLNLKVAGSLKIS